MKICKGCCILLTDENKYAHGSRCKKCHNEASIAWSKAHPDRVKVHRRKRGLKKKYGMSNEEYSLLLKAQNGVCAICKKIHLRRPLNVDHCHQTNRIRGLLCDKCNMAIGLLNDDIALIHRLVGYLS